MNNNFWQKLISRLIDKNPHYDPKKTIELLNENYSDAISIALNDYSAGERKTSCKKLKTLTNYKNGKAILNLDTSLIQAQFTERLAGQTI